jgi:hypothetical protein
MRATLNLEIQSGSLERASVDLAIAGIFADERPLRGGAGQADWRLCGQISELLRDQHFDAKIGEALLVPTLGRLQAPRFLGIGLGPQATCGADQVRISTQIAVERAVALGVQTVALLPLGIASHALPQHAGAILGGSIAGMAGGEASLSLRLLIPDDEALLSARALEEAARAESSDAVALSLPTSPGAGRPSRHSRGGGAAPLGT